MKKRLQPGYLLVYEIVPLNFISLCSFLLSLHCVNFLCAAQPYRFQQISMIVVQHRLHIIGNKRFPKNLFPDAWLTKDGVALLPVHRVILAGASAKFKKLFQREEGEKRVHVVPLVDFDILKKVVNFIYDGEIALESREEQNDFIDALATLQVEVGEIVVRSRRQSKMEEDEAVTQTQDVKKLRLSGGFDYSRLNLERSTKGNKDKVDIDKVKEAKLNAKLMKLSREVYDGKRNAPKDDENTISDKLSGKTPKSDLGEEADGKESRESFIASAKTQPCVFYAKGHCMRGKTCWFLHDKSAQDSEENQNTEKHVDRESRQEVFVVVDSTVMVKTLDLEGYFSKFGDVLAVKYLGLNSEGWSEFQVEMKLSASDTLAILNRKAHRIREIEVKVKHEKRSSGSDHGRKDREMFRSPSGDERRKRNLNVKRSTSRRSMTGYHRESHEP